MAPIYNVDRAVGTLVTAAAVACAAYACHAYIFRRGDSQSDKKKDKSIEEGYYRTRYHAAERREAYVWHHGACHCMRVQFNVFAPPVVHAVDVPSKLRFPRLSIGSEDFRLLCDESHLSLYTIENCEGGCTGGYSFCRFCGMQVLFAPFLQPKELQVNLDCLSTDTIAEVHIAYHSASDPVPAHEPTRYMYGDVPSRYHTPMSNLTTPMGDNGLFSSAHSSPSHFHGRDSPMPHYPGQSPPRANAPSHDMSMDTQRSESTEDIYRVSLDAIHYHRGGGYKYSIDGDSDTMSSSECFDQEPSLDKPRPSLCGSGKYSDDGSYSSYSGKRYSEGAALEQCPAIPEEEPGVDVTALYPSLKKYMQRHV